MKENNKIRVGITHGDFNGIGYEVILKTLAEPHIQELCVPVVYGSPNAAEYYRQRLELPEVRYNVIDTPDQAVDDPTAHTVNIINVVGAAPKIAPGTSTPEAGAVAVAALDRAVADLRSGAVDVLVTAPINKNNVQSDTFTFPGHTEYLETSLRDDEHPGHALMILFNDVVRVALVTTHLPVASVSAALSKELVAAKIKEMAAALTRDFGVHRPRIAVLGLNPHAGDGGLLGSEETEIITPAIREAAEEGVLAFGPYAADGFFGTGSFRRFDGVLAMYHDQGLAPFKTLAGTSGVNFTAGLSRVRTSPDHGTAYDIAGTGTADETSMRQAIYSAIDIFRNRSTHAEITRNPLRKQYVERNKSDNVVLDLTKDE